MKHDEETYDFVADLYRNIDSKDEALSSGQAGSSDQEISAPVKEDELESLSQALQMFRDDAARLPEPDESLSLAILKQEKLLHAQGAGSALSWWEKLFASMMHPAFAAATLVLILGSAGLYQLLKAPVMKTAMQEPAAKVALPMSAADEGRSKHEQAAAQNPVPLAKNSAPMLQKQWQDKETPMARPVARWEAGDKQKARQAHRAERKSQAKSRRQTKALNKPSIGRAKGSPSSPAATTKGSWGGFAPVESAAPKPNEKKVRPEPEPQGLLSEQVLAGSAGQLTDPKQMRTGDMDRDQGGGGHSGLAMGQKSQKEDSIVADSEAPTMANKDVASAGASAEASAEAKAVQDESQMDDLSINLPAATEKASAAAPAKKRRAPANKTPQSLPGLRSRSRAKQELAAGKPTGSGRGGLDDMNRNRLRRQALDQFVAGMRAFQMRHYDEALGLFSRTEHMQPRGTLGDRARVMRARSLFKLKRYREASKLFEWALKNKVKVDNHAQIVDELASCYARMGRTQQADQLRQSDKE